MPEGDSVHRLADRLGAALIGQVLTEADLRVPQYATADLVGRTVEEVVARGKHLLIRMSGGVTLHTHLRMDGSWHVRRSAAAGGARQGRGGPTHQIRVVLATKETRAIGYRLPVVELLRTGDENRAVGHLGPDLLGPDWDADEAVRRLSAQSDSELGPALLDQRNLAGIGNVFAAETCFVAGVSPWMKIGDVVNLRRVVDVAHRLLTDNRHTQRRITTGDPRRPYWVYDRGGLPCRRCGTPIRSAAQGRPPHQRTTYWCPTCQPRREPSGDPRRYGDPS